MAEKFFNTDVDKFSPHAMMCELNDIAVLRGTSTRFTHATNVMRSSPKGAAVVKDKKKPKSSTARTELQGALERVSHSDALAKIAADSQVPRVLVWESKPGVWSRYAVKENDLKIGFADTFDTAMKRAKNKFPNSRIEHDAKMTDKVAKGLKKKFEATVDAARAEAGKEPITRSEGEVIKPAKGKGKGPGKEPKQDDPDKAMQIADLIEELRGATDPEEKKRIRRKLRARGHYGGLGDRPKATGPAPKAPKGKAKADPDEDDDDLDMDEDD